GDAWAREELRQLGQSLKGLMRLQNAYTATISSVRAEGWTMQGFVQCYLATGDESLKNYAIARLHLVVDPQRLQNHPSKAIAFQDNYAGTLFPLNHKFFMPWQHAAVLFGYLGAFEFLADPLFLHVCEDVPTTVDYSWVRNYQDPTYGLVANGLRYYVPVEFDGAPIPANFWDGTPGVGVRWGDAPLGGAHTFLIAPLLLLADQTPIQSVWQKALLYGAILRGPPLNDNDRWEKWHYCIPEWYTQ
ncbi:MAG TPA: hypothetical protein VK348_10525, partial [Planctomycetota bacterium]|nr:hypothetical protein [Planctomycetota bacterium]